jgi:hypothetical protein
MKFTLPHWTTGVISVIGAAAGALAAANTFPAETGLLAGVAAICALLAAPTVASK